LGSINPSVFSEFPVETSFQPVVFNFLFQPSVYVEGNFEFCRSEIGIRSFFNNRKGRYLLKTSADGLAKEVLESEQNINEAFKFFVFKPYSFRIKAKKNVNTGMSCLIWFIYLFN
jgi:hypothetical protein